MPSRHFPTADPRRNAQNVARQGQEQYTKDSQRYFLGVVGSWLLIENRQKEAPVPLRTQFSIRTHTAVEIPDHNINFATLVKQPRCSATTDDTRRKHSVILVGRHALFFRDACKALASMHKMLKQKKRQRGPSSLKGQRMTHNAGTIDGVTQTTFYMAPPSGTPGRAFLIPRAHEKCVSAPFIRLLHHSVGLCKE